MQRKILAAITPILLAGCANMSGLDANSKFACKAPDGVTCTSLSGVYANVVANNYPNQQKQENEDGAAKGAESAHKITGIPASSGDPIRSPQKVVRVWIAPWEDAEGDLHDQSFVYVVARDSEWVIEHNRRAITERFRPTFMQAGRMPQQKTGSAPSNQNPSSVEGLSAPALPGNQLLPPPGRQLSSETQDGESQ